MKRPNLQIMGIEEGEEIQTKGIDNLFNKIVIENIPQPQEREGHPGARSLQNTKPSGPKKKHPQTDHNQNTQHTKQRQNTENCKREKKSYIKANPIE
jgi:hypothetical protein